MWQKEVGPQKMDLKRGSFAEISLCQSVAQSEVKAGLN